MNPYIFISYRRADTLAAARGLMRFLHSHYGRQAVFMDSAEIRDGSNWRLAIENALERATVLIPVIGKNWLLVKDESGRPRIHRSDDWVRREVEHAIVHGTKIIPIYVGVPPYGPEIALPAGLEALAEAQGRSVGEADAEAQWKLLGLSLERLGFGQMRADVRYPRAMVQLQPYTDDELDAVLKRLPGWRCVASPLPGMEHVIRSELHNAYEFDSFETAMRFIADAAPAITRAEHHPRWENIWRTVQVWLTTWDLQFQVSQLDVDLALHLDRVARTLRANSL